jgi:RNA polymerase sigma factor (sigma-70 family)
VDARVEAHVATRPDAPAGNRNDQALAAAIAAIAKGDERALEALYDETVGRVFGLALRIVRNRESAEEVTEDVFIQAWRSAATFDAARGAPIAWLLTICRSRALDHLRRAEPALAHPDPQSLRAAVDVEHDDDPQSLLAAARDHAQLKRALESLTPQQRQLVALAFFRGFTHQEIAAHSGLPLGSVKTWIRRALAVLRKELENAS